MEGSIKMDLTKFTNKDGKILLSLLEFLPVPAFYKNKEGVYAACNQLFEKTLGLSKKDIIGKTSFDLYNKELALKHIKMNNKLYLNGKTQIYDGTLILSDGSSAIFRFHKSILTNKSNEPIGFICIAICIKTEKKLEKLAMYDPLTGLFNRGTGLNLLSKKLQKCRDKKEVLSIVIMDIDYFKKINDTYGHICGDKILKKIARILKFNLRAKDVVFRYGGEEFLAALPYTDSKKAYSICERIRKKISQLSVVSDDGIEIKVSASFGISQFPENGKTESELIKKADLAMYKVKDNGRNGVKII